MLFKICLITVANGVNRSTVINSPVYMKCEYTPKTLLFSFPGLPIYILWIWHLLQFMTTEFKLTRNRLSFSLPMKGSAHLRGPGKKCSLGNHSSFPLLPPFWSCPEISERQTCTFYVLPPAKGQLQFSPSGREETMAAFTYFNCFHIHTCAMHKHPYMPCFSHTVKREGMLCTSFFLNATLICSQAKDILLYTM